MKVWYGHAVLLTSKSPPGDFLKGPGGISGHQEVPSKPKPKIAGLLTQKREVPQRSIPSGNSRAGAIWCEEGANGGTGESRRAAGRASILEFVPALGSVGGVASVRWLLVL